MESIVKRFILAASSFLLIFLTPSPSRGEDIKTNWKSGHFKFEESKMWMTYHHVRDSDLFGVGIIQPRNDDYQGYKIPSLMIIDCKSGKIDYRTGFSIKVGRTMDWESMNRVLGTLGADFCDTHQSEFKNSPYWNLP